MCVGVGVGAFHLSITMFDMCFMYDTHKEIDQWEEVSGSRW